MTRLIIDRKPLRGVKEIWVLTIWRHFYLNGTKLEPFVYYNQNSFAVSTFSEKPGVVNVIIIISDC